MAEHFVSIYGTEKDKVNCPFYYKIGACRHGDRCSRVHNKPLFSQTIMLPNLYHSPAQIEEYARQQSLPQPCISDEERRNHFDDFFNDILDEMSRYGRVESVNVCENLSEHLAGNTYVKFADEESAAKALKAVHGRYYAGVPVKAEFSPVTDFREGKCRPFEKHGKCDRGDYCHFMHLRKHAQPEERRNQHQGRYYNNRYRDERHASADGEHDGGRDGGRNSRGGGAGGAGGAGGDDRRRSRYQDYDRDFDYRRDTQRHDSQRHRDRSPPRNANSSYDRDDYRSGQRYNNRHSYDRVGARDRDDRQYYNDRDNRRPRNSYRQRDTYKEYDYRRDS